jgi:hypothetical protein
MDVSRPYPAKGQAQKTACRNSANRLPYMIAEKGQRTKDEKAYNMKRSCLKKASSFCSICKARAKNEKPGKTIYKIVNSTRKPQASASALSLHEGHFFCKGALSHL